MKEQHQFELKLVPNYISAVELSFLCNLSRVLTLERTPTPFSNHSLSFLYKNKTKIVASSTSSGSALNLLLILYYL